MPIPARIGRVSGDLIPHPEARMSDADREQVVQRLQTAVGEGRLTLDEFQERVDGVLRCRTFGEAGRYVADLPAAFSATPPAQREVAELRSVASPIRRRGRWNVARRLVISNRAGAVKLDFTEAVIASPVVDIQLNVVAGSTVLVVPDGASVDADDVEMIAGSLRIRSLPTVPDATAGPHFRVTGIQKAGSLTVRRQRRFWRWRW